jgi:DNA-binding transcriptional ArsR family regulator|tara:strand:+ start:42233 stop:42535 length:303 start_codon:yes stop_codon:yes gene_type:complete
MPYEDQFAALSHPLRQKILDTLQSAPSTVRELTDRFDASQPVISQHLKVLRDAGLVDATPQGTSRLYRIEEAQLNALRNFLEEHWQNKLKQLGEEPPYNA